jgi:anti-sigma factor RsiW
MDCERARTLVLDRVRGRLSPDDAPALDQHLEGCANCRRAEEVERATDELLSRRPVHRAPAGLESRLRARYAPRPPRRRISPILLLAAAAFLIAIVVGVWRTRTDDHRALEARLVQEAVNDHLRILYSEHPLDIASGGIHQVKPWFAGRLDFAPMKIFEGDAELPLQGGSVAVMLDRKAAAFIYKRRLHQVTLLVTRAEGLPWPPPNQDAGRLRVHVEVMRGFSTVTWTENELGYALISDIDRNELAGIAPRIATR